MKKIGEELKKGLSKKETYVLAKLSSSGKRFITIEDIENQVHDLGALINVKSIDELEKMKKLAGIS
mgnify:CR=1 FL=1